MIRMTKGGFALGLAMLVAAQPAQAAMGCWNQRDASAAKVRDLQSRLMVASLRCRAMGFDILPSYNKFVRTSRGALQDSNGLIKARFAAAYGKGAAQSRYDSFTTAMANTYGGDQTSQEICRETAAIAKEAAEADGDIDRLVAIGESMGRTPRLPGGECPVAFAAKGSK